MTTRSSTRSKTPAAAHYVQAAQLWGASDSIREKFDRPEEFQEREPYAHLILTARTALGEDAFETARKEGAAWTLEEAVAYARSSSV